jgi:hypothetical protein
MSLGGCTAHRWTQWHGHMPSSSSVRTGSTTVLAFNTWSRWLPLSWHCMALDPSRLLNWDNSADGVLYNMQTHSYRRRRSCM